MPEPSSTEAEAAPINRYYLAILQTGMPNDPLGDMNRYALDVVQEKLESKIETDPARNEIDVWLESPGGQAGVAYKLFLDLRSRCRKLRSVIPDYAKSAATLFVLGTDEIFMGAAAELGPLDAQIEHPDREGVTVSALDVAKAFDFLGEFAVSFAISGGAQVLGWTQLPRTDVLREFLRFTASFLEPVVSKLDPHLIHRATNQLEIAQQYAEIMLRGRRLSESDESDDFDPALIAHRFIRHYPAHEFAISLSSAADLGLPAKDVRSYARWDKARIVYDDFRGKMFNRNEHCSRINVYNENDLEGLLQDRSDGAQGGDENETQS